MGNLSRIWHVFLNTVTELLMKNPEDQRMLEQLESAILRQAGPKTMRRDRPYNGQSHTHTGERGSLVVSGLTQRDLYDCMIRGYIQSHLVYKDGTLEPLEPNATLSREASKGVYAQLNANDMFSLVGGVDPLAVIQNTLCEVEKLMGEFPMNLTNLSLLEEKECVHQTGPYSYICKSGKTIERRTLSEHNTSQYAWVLYKNNAEVDRDQSLEALAERNNLEITTY